MPREWTDEQRAAIAERQRAHQARLKAEREAGRAALAAAEPVADPSPLEPAPVMPPMPEDDGGGMTQPVFDEEPETGAPVSLDPFEVFFGSLSQETRDLLSEDDLREAFAKANDQAREERRAQLRKAAAEKAKAHARASAGLVPKEQMEVLAWQDKMSRKVRWTPIMPFVSDTGGIADEGLLVDGRRYYHGQEVETTYGEWLSAREMIWRLRQHELDFEGKGRLHHLRRMVNERGFDFQGARQ
jgi:hypothetical protein